MFVKNNFLPISNEVLGTDDKYITVEATDYYKYIDGKRTDERLGSKITVLILNAERDIFYEKLDVKVPNADLSNFKPNEYIKFNGLKLNASSVEFGKTKIIGFADSYEMVSDNLNDDGQIKGQIKLNLDSKK